MTKTMTMTMTMTMTTMTMTMAMTMTMTMTMGRGSRRSRSRSRKFQKWAAPATLRNTLFTSRKPLRLQGTSQRIAMFPAPSWNISSPQLNPSMLRYSLFLPYSLFLSNQRQDDCLSGQDVVAVS